MTSDEVLKRYPKWPWVPVAQLAREREANPRTFRRWLHNVNDAAGGNVLRGGGKRGGAPLMVNVKALDAHAGPNAKERDAIIEQLAARVEDLERKLAGLERYRHWSRVLLLKLKGQKRSP